MSETTISFSGPVSVTPELTLALWDAMTPTGQQGTAQLYFARFISGPITEAALVAGAKVMCERVKIPAAAEKAMRDAVAKKCAELGEKSTNPQQVVAIVNDETRKAAAEYAQQKLDTLLSAIPMEALIEAVTPVIAEVVKTCSHHYFTRSQPGQDKMLALVNRVFDEEAENSLRETVKDKIEEVAEPVLNGRLKGRKLT